MKPLTRKEYIAVGAALAVIALIFFVGNGLSFFTTGSLGTANVSQPAEDNQNTNVQNNTQASVTSLQITDVSVGTGAEAKFGSDVAVNYKLTLADGREIDNSYKRGEALPFKLGVGQVIPGFDQGVTGMKVGGKRTVIIPPALGYGSGQVGPIPPDSVLYFEVELVSVK
jgi:FKBP-type peptidyl-prolyl cis-trans isomerase FkpA